MRLVAGLKWQSLEDGGAESTQLWQRGDEHVLHGFALRFGPEQRFDYTVVIAPGWLTREVVVRCSDANGLHQTTLTRTDDARWWVDGTEDDALYGCTDVDFGFSPATNLMPIRRLLAGENEVQVLAAWFQYPSQVVVPAEQRYRMIAPGHVHFRSAGFEAELTINRHGLVTMYPELWSTQPE